MDIRQITKDYAVAPQIGPEHVKLIKVAGFKSVICNRPDAEDGAVPHGEIEKAVREAGMEFRFIPVVSGQLTVKDVADQAAALDDLPKPVLAYCRTGARCSNLYAMVEQYRKQGS